MIAAFALAILAPAAQATDPHAIDWLRGDWAVYLEGKPVPDRGCGSGTRYEPSADGHSVLAVTPGKDMVTTYSVVRIEPDRVLTIIDDETRLTDQGDTVLWWFVRKGDDEFTFRQYGWDPTGHTPASWKRCPA